MGRLSLAADARDAAYRLAAAPVSGPIRGFMCFRLSPLNPKPLAQQMLGLCW